MLTLLVWVRAQHQLTYIESDEEDWDEEDWDLVEMPCDQQDLCDCGVFAAWKIRQEILDAMAAVAEEGALRDCFASLARASHPTAQTIANQRLHMLLELALGPIDAGKAGRLSLHFLP